MTKAEQRRALTRVIFKREGTHILAVFPREPGTRDPHTCGIYAPHDGGHGSADATYCASLPRAKPGEYGWLKAHLEGLGYRLDVRKRIAGRADLDARRLALRASRKEA